MAGYGHKGSARPSLVIDETGKIYGEFTVLHQGTKTKSGAIKWTCRCSCGETVDVVGQSLRSGKSSRCTKCSRKRDRRSGTGAFSKSRNLYSHRARKAGIAFPLSLEEFITFVTGACHYCGELPTKERRAYNRPSMSGTGLDDVGLMHGIDRVDSSKSYLKDNIVPCCFVCNRMKSDFGTEFFLKHIAKIYKYNEKGDNDRTTTSNVGNN